MIDNSELLDPFQVLGVSKDAGEDQIRARYLELVKQFSPEREPERFREVQAAFQAAKDPLVIASRLLEPPSEGKVPRWSEAIEAQKRLPPSLSVELLLSFGNREDTSHHEKTSDEGQATSELTTHETDQVDIVSQEEMAPSQRGQKPIAPEPHFVEKPHE